MKKGNRITYITPSPMDEGCDANTKPTHTATWDMANRRIIKRELYGNKIISIKPTRPNWDGS